MKYLYSPLLVARNYATLRKVTLLRDLKELVFLGSIGEAWKKIQSKYRHPDNNAVIQLTRFLARDRRETLRDPSLLTARNVFSLLTAQRRAGGVGNPFARQ